MADVFKHLIKQELKKQKPKSSYKLNAGLIHSEPAAASRNTKISRYIPIELRRQVLEKYDHRCNFHAGEGASEKRFLDIDYIRPVSKDGKTEFSNLQPLFAQTTIAIAQ
jgi:predicted restriction endonuclease